MLKDRPTSSKKSHFFEPPWVIKNSCTRWGSSKWHHELGITKKNFQNFVLTGRPTGPLVSAGIFDNPRWNRDLEWRNSVWNSIHEVDPFKTKIYDVPLKFARKLIHGGPVHPCGWPMGAIFAHTVPIPTWHAWFYLIFKQVSPERVPWKHAFWLPDLDLWPMTLIF